MSDLGINLIALAVFGVIFLIEWIDQRRYRKVMDEAKRKAPIFKR